jgi:hypothetical protein
MLILLMVRLGTRAPDGKQLVACIGFSGTCVRLRPDLNRFSARGFWLVCVLRRQRPSSTRGLRAVENLVQWTCQGVFAIGFGCVFFPCGRAQDVVFIGRHADRGIEPKSAANELNAKQRMR